MPLVLAVLLPAVLAAALSAQQGARDEENLIKGLLRDKLYDLAADRVFDFVFKYPQNPRREQMLFGICDLLMKNGKEVKSVPLLRCYLQEFPDGRRRDPVRLMLARAQITVGEYAPAVALLKEIVNDSGYGASDLAEARLMLAEQFLAQERFEEAVSLLEGNVSRGAAPQSRLSLARAHHALGHREEAEELLRGLVARTRRDSAWRDAREALATLLIETAHYQDCVDLLQSWSPAEGKTLSGEDRSLALALAVSHYHLGDYATAFEILSAIWEETRGRPDPASHIPAVMISLQEWRSAAEMLLTRFSGTEGTLQRRRVGGLLAEALIESGRMQEAVRTLNGLAAEEARADESARLLMRAAGLAPDQSRQLELLDKAEGKSPSQTVLADILFLKAKILERSGKWNDAVAVLRRIRGLDDPAVDGAEAALRIGTALFGQGAYGEAEPALREAILLHGEPEIDSRAYPLLIRCLLLLRRWQGVEDAFEAFSARLGEGAVPASVWRDVATARAATGNHGGSAEAVLQAAISREPSRISDLDRLFLFLAAQSDKAGEALQAEAVCERLLASGDEAVRHSARTALISSAIRRGQWALAIDHCEALLEGDPEGWVADWARFTMARGLGNVGRLPEKAVILRGLIKARPGGPFASAAVEELQSMALQAGQYDAALRADPAFNALGPERQYEADRTLRQAQIAFLSGQPERAVSLYRIHSDPLKMPQLHRFIFASALFRNGDSEAAYPLLASLDPEQLLVPQRWDRELALAEIHHRMGRADQALTLYQSLLEGPLPVVRRLSALFGAARAAESSGRWPRAQNLYRQYLLEAKKVEPDVARVKAVADSFAAHGDLEAASRLFFELGLLAEDTDEAVRYSFRAAEMLELAGQEDRAVEEFLRIAYQHPGLIPWAARARLRLAMIYERLERFDAAERQYDFVAERYPETEEGKAAARRLTALQQRRRAIEEEQIGLPDR